MVTVPQPRVKNALEPEVLSTVDTLRKAGASKKRIQQYIHENSVCTPTNQDVHNLVRRLEKREHTASTSAKWLKQWVQEFSEESGNVAGIFVDSVQNKNIATCITLQTAHMRQLFDFLPEVWMIDATHGTNSSKYKLLVYAKTEREYKRLRDYMHYIMGIGRRSASGRTELGPGSSELGAGGAELGAGSAELESDESNDDAPQHPFEAYFVKNWDKCRSMWCAFERQNAVTLANNTKNRIEASWKQLKDLVDSFMEVDECIVSIMYYRAQEEKKLMDSLFKLSVVHDPNSHACELIYEQYVFATTRGKYKYKEAVPGVFLVQYVSDEEDALDEPTSKYSVMKRDWTCSCMFMTSRLLPCRHVFYLRKALGFESIIHTQLLHPRWLLTTLRSSTDAPQLPGAPLAVSSVLPEPRASWNSNRKFRETNAVASTISEQLSGLVLQDVAKRFKHGEYTAISRMTDVAEPADALQFTELPAEHHVAQDLDVSSSASVQTTQLGMDGSPLGTDRSQLGSYGSQLGSDGFQLVSEENPTNPDGLDTSEEVNSSQAESTLPVAVAPPVQAKKK
ncbi:hypothetical protein PHYSODRAFT_301446 [Phytophthora sojae]|uniref:SWIM-type domain-containing protein n=1 Tax=Phytophthora sojae (strain P6497) TaxID=1094619 RepID=G4ZDU3_PHYSP|nr:hypothetical protein PHYSODRAFT_301446 [Phytophthora sojae]EGZ19022.1 hypothetical protein PHYSODRAFT_301446 [Phytophthora sojae]|eukprot:XP_009528080.1 hypothetical protein PHYSODRAFT_301446 [Phytophthora sojae]